MSTANLVIAATADDGEEDDGTTWVSAGFSGGGSTAAIYIGRYGNSPEQVEEAGFRFLNCGIPQGSTINLATLSLWSLGIDAGSLSNIHMKIVGVNVDSAAVWSSTNRPSNASHTTASIAWDPASWAAGGYIALPACTSVIQELVNRAGFTSSSNIGLCLLDNGSVYSGGAQDLMAEDYAGNSAHAAKLDIDYTAPGGGGGSAIAVISDYHRRMQRRNRVFF